MESELITKDSVEAIPLGDLRLSILGDSFWSENARCQRLSDTIVELLEYVRRVEKSGSGILRLVRVTVDFASEVTEWQRQLGEPEVLSSGCVGKVFVWGNGAMQSTYAVIVLPERLALDFIEDSERAGAIAKGTLVHEMVHIHDEYELLRDLGPKVMPMNDDWQRIRKSIARSIWAEFSADFVAYRWYGAYLLEEQSRLAADILRRAQEDIDQEIIRYREHGEIADLWQCVGSSLSQVFNQIGRSVGLLIAAQEDGRDQLEAFFEGIKGISTDWEQLTRRLAAELRILLEQNAGDFGRLAMIVEHGFLTAGVRPIANERGLRVEILTPIPD